jgi:hypothetical protein
VTPAVLPWQPRAFSGQVIILSQTDDHKLGVTCALLWKILKEFDEI